MTRSIFPQGKDELRGGKDASSRGPGPLVWMKLCWYVSQNKSLDTMAKFELGCNYSPGGSDGRPLHGLPAKVLSRKPALVEESFLKMLYDVSHATFASNIRVRANKRMKKLKGNLRQMTKQPDLTSSKLGSVESACEGLTDQWTRWWTDTNFMKMTGLDGRHGTCACQTDMIYLATEAQSTLGKHRACVN